MKKFALIALFALCVAPVFAADQTINVSVSVPSLLRISAPAITASFEHTAFGETGSYDLVRTSALSILSNHGGTLTPPATVTLTTATTPPSSFDATVALSASSYVAGSNSITVTVSKTIGTSISPGVYSGIITITVSE